MWHSTCHANPPESHVTTTHNSCKRHNFFSETTNSNGQSLTALLVVETVWFPGMKATNFHKFGFFSLSHPLNQLLSFLIRIRPVLVSAAMFQHACALARDYILYSIASTTATDPPPATQHNVQLNASFRPVPSTADVSAIPFQVATNPPAQASDIDQPNPSPAIASAPDPPESDLDQPIPSPATASPPDPPEVSTVDDE